MVTKDYLQSGGHFRVKGWSNVYIVTKIGAIKMQDGRGDFYAHGQLGNISDTWVEFRKTFMGEQVSVTHPFTNLEKADK